MAAAEDTMMMMMKEAGLEEEEDTSLDLTSMCHVLESIMNCDRVHKLLLCNSFQYSNDK